MKRVAILAFSVLVIGCSTQLSPTGKRVNMQQEIEHPVVRKPLAEVGTNGNDDLVAPFGRFGQQDTVYGLNGRDDINGHNGDDDLYGGNSPDRIAGDYDEDCIVGGRGWGDLSGGAMLTPSKLLTARKILLPAAMASRIRPALTKKRMLRDVNSSTGNV